MPTNKPEVVLPELPEPDVIVEHGYGQPRTRAHSDDQLRTYGQACIDTLTRPADGEFHECPHCKGWSPPLPRLGMVERRRAVDFGPIERDEQMDRTYIPMPGGWEIQTKGKGSTFRICDPTGERLPIPESPYLHETLERMAREVHAAARAGTPPPAIDIGKLRELVEVLNHAIATQLGARVTIHATRARQIRDELAALIGDGGRAK